jgi:hypothetical protein
MAKVKSKSKVKKHDSMLKIKETNNEILCTRIVDDRKV